MEISTALIEGNRALQPQNDWPTERLRPSHNVAFEPVGGSELATSHILSREQARSYSRATGGRTFFSLAECPIEWLRLSVVAVVRKFPSAENLRLATLPELAARSLSPGSVLLRFPTRHRAFTLLELLVVMGLMATLSVFLLGGLGHGGKSAALQSAQAVMANGVVAARTQALASGQSCRVLIHADPLSVSEPRRYLRYVVIQLQTATGWQTVTDTFLPTGVYVVPGNFSSLPSGLFAPSSTVPWTKADGSALRSTALRSNQITTEIINDTIAEQWVGVTLSANAGTLQSGDIILATGRRRAPGTFAEGEAPIELENPANVRGLTLSAYGVPALINTRLSF